LALGAFIKDTFLPVMNAYLVWSPAERILASQLRTGTLNVRRRQ
jgi:hypothetical protein